MIGNSSETIKRILGNPSFIDGKVDVFGYKTKEYYIMFVGKDKVEEVSIIKRSMIPKEYTDMLKDFATNMKEKTDYINYDSVLKKYPNYSSCSHIRGGGWITYYQFGISFTVFENNTVEVNNDFEGTLVDN